MLSQAHRFHGHGSLRYVYKHGKSVRSHLITIKVSKNPYRKEPRFAVVVSKKVHKAAVGRNRMRRRLYEIVRKEIPYLDGPYDIVLLVFSNEVITMPAPELETVVKQLLAQADVYKKDEKAVV